VRTTSLGQKEIKHAILFTVVTMVLLGGAYHLVIWVVGQAVFASQAEGSLIRRADGTVVGSSLIAQRFTRPEYFQPRPSGVDYNAASTGGTNYGPSNPDHLKAVQERLDAVTKLEDVTADRVPSEMVTAGGGGMDPHIPPAAAELQVARVASAVIFNAVIIIALIPLVLRGISYKPLGAAAILQRNLLVYGLGGVILPFIGIKAIDLVLVAVGLA
jgi:K+-transporting ATPase ATPase C chain